MKFIWINLFCLLVAYPVFGQLVKTDLTESDYGQWGTLRLGKISKDGKWVALSMIYESGQDTLYLRSTNNTKQFAFPKGIEPAFEGEYFACITEGKVAVMNLANNSTSYDAGVRFNFFSNKAIAILSRSENKASSLKVRTLSGQIALEIPDVVEYTLTKNTLLYNRKLQDSSFVGIVDYRGKKTKNTVIFRKRGELQNLVWNKEGTAVSFLGSDLNEDRLTSIFHYDLVKNKLSSIIPQQSLNVTDTISITTAGIYRHWISNDGKKVFFAIQRKNNSYTKNHAVEIWNSSDKWTHNLEVQLDGWKNVPKASVWMLEEKKASVIGDNILPYARVFGDGKYALLSNPQSYEPQFKEEAPRDYYLLDIEAQKRTLLFHQLPGAANDIQATPDGKYLIYYDNNSWYAYNVLKDSSSALTTTGLSIWESDPNDYNSEPRVYGIAGFSTDNSSVFLYDRFDLWEVGITKSFAIRLTDGKEKGIRFRLAISAGNPGKTDPDPIDINKQLYLKAYREKDGVSGYYTLKDNKLQKLIFDNNCIDELVYASGIDIFREQSFDMPTRAIALVKGKRTVLFESNPKIKKYNWPFSKMITYRTMGVEKPAALFLPPNYDANKKYPVIVHIYEDMSPELHHFVNPTWRNPEGYNITTQAADGYCVVLPDLNYESNNAGVSAARSLIDLTKMLVDEGIANPKAIGLMGHSFGGYETFFTITHTNVFAAAIAGSGISDTVNWYYSMSQDLEKPEMWRFEDQQFRMTKPYHLDPKSYLLNSPILNVNNVSTPLLSYSGKNDRVVPWQQSMTFYLALRRMKKQTTLLLYPDEGHVLSSPDNQKDLSLKVKAWFDHYLKNLPSSGWMDQQY
ncbi:Dipeptidyl aminopeptidase/acylaminoacyl peptidase [Flavobacterium gillisiae]|uniref:Dipeptidyl aminopeptidase/acylaminoacyl peptidase n=1 Tax=Flavobacterium gillisiae TaxID=150146 RepID=A0A1H4ERS1_9FLAO|nr:prolyl oligopeptidase family serine peptidase [Flavobacterium gillisiae]SEA87569.1 Dipeptidyl aminopeptidase/acylaminoacyl peptidase [Flavobacterium gillisiae]